MRRTIKLMCRVNYRNAMMPIFRSQGLPLQAQSSAARQRRPRVKAAPRIITPYSDKAIKTVLLSTAYLLHMCRNSKQPRALRALPLAPRLSHAMKTQCPNLND
jgi:hypothetical protein